MFDTSSSGAPAIRSYNSTILLADIEASESHGQLKEMALQILGTFSPVSDPRESLERMLRLNLAPHTYVNIINEWAAEDPEAARAWYFDTKTAIHQETQDLFSRARMDLVDSCSSVGIILPGFFNLPKCFGSTWPGSDHL